MTKQEEIRERTSSNNVVSLGKVRKLRNDLTILISDCYSKEGSACKLHPVFQPQKFLNKLFPYLHSQGVVIKVAQMYPFHPRFTYEPLVQDEKTDSG